MFCMEMGLEKIAIIGTVAAFSITNALAIILIA